MNAFYHFFNFWPTKVRNSQISPEFVSMSATILAYNLVVFVVVLCVSPKPNLPEHILYILIYFPSIMEHAPENRVGILKA